MSKEVIQKIREYVMPPDEYPVTVTYDVSEGCADLPNTYDFLWALLELVNNCAEKPEKPHVNVSVSIQFDPENSLYTMTVEDDVVYDGDLSRTVKILNSRPKKHGKKKRVEINDDAIMDTFMSLPTVRNIFTTWDGGLEYSASPDNRIIATATWSRDTMLRVYEEKAQRIRERHTVDK